MWIIRWTGAVAVFTFFLALIGSWQGIQLKRSVDILSQSERAQLFVIVQSKTIENLIRPIRLSLRANERSNEDELVGDNETAVQCIFKNYGKTPAIVKEINLNLAYYENLPVEPVYIARDTVLSEFMISGGGETDPQPCQLAHRLTRAQAIRVIRAHSYIWFYGRIVYDDIFGREHQHRFLWRYGGERGFRPNFEHARYIQNT
jgi:hypothetical protein